MKKNQKGNIDEGYYICESQVVEDKKQTRLQIPILIKGLLGMKHGDKFRWYVKRREYKQSAFIKISAVYVGNNKAKYKREKMFKNKKLGGR